ncbi:MAG: hypothetical protein K6U03_07180, partial [Firmicutes bacterium]|nr:hypothetical protein [Bacillota bacterium]
MFSLMVPLKKKTSWKTMAALPCSFPVLGFSVDTEIPPPPPPRPVEPVLTQKSKNPARLAGLFKVIQNPI